MRVTFASYDDTPPLGGQGVMLESMRDALSRRGVDVATVAGRGRHGIAYPPVLHRAPLDFSLHLNRHPTLLLGTAPDVVHVLGGPGGVLLLRRLAVPVVYTANHTYRQAHTRRSVKRALAPLEAVAYRRAQRVLALSRSTAHALLAVGVPQSRVEVLMPGVDIPADVGVHEPATLLFAGRLEPEKGVLDAVMVMRDLIRSGHAERGEIIGDGSLAAAVRSLTATLPQITVHGTVSAASLRAAYARATLVLMPSRYEGLGLVALEAQAAATPVAGYDVDGLRDAVNGDGVLVPPGDRGALHDAVAALLSDPQRREAMGATAQRRMREQHSWDTVARRLVTVYEAARSR